MDNERIKELIGVETSKMLLAYDAKTSVYENDNSFKEGLIQFLRNKEAKEISSSVASTLYFITTEHTPLSFWSKQIIEKYGKSFQFSLAVIAKDDNKYLHLDYPIISKK